MKSGIMMDAAIYVAVDDHGVCSGRESGVGSWEKVNMCVCVGGSRKWGLQKKK